MSIVKKSIEEIRKRKGQVDREKIASLTDGDREGFKREDGFEDQYLSEPEVILESASIPALRFTGQPKVDALDFLISHPTGYLDAELASTFVDALKVLVHAIGLARPTENVDGNEGHRAAREMLVGFSILTVNEARAFLIVAGAGLDRHARIHFRALMEYEFRILRIFEEEDRAIAFRDAFAHEARKFANDLETLDEEAIEASIEDALGFPVEGWSCPGFVDSVVA